MFDAGVFVELKFLLVDNFDNLSFLVSNMHCIHWVPFHQVLLF